MLSSPLPMHGEPNGLLRRVGPLDAVSDMRGQFEPVAGVQFTRPGLAIDQYCSRAGDHADPLVPSLIVPKAGRTSLSHRDDTLNAHAGPYGEFIDLFLRERFGKARENAAGADHARHPK